MLRYTTILILLLVSLSSCKASVEGNEAQLVLSPREKIIMQAQGAIGQHEATGHNDGPFVDEVLATVGMKGTGSPWCAAFDRWVYDYAGFKETGPRSALASDWVSKPTWKQGTGKTPKPGDPIGIWIRSMNGVHHTGLVESWGKNFAIIIAGNTNNAGSREGEGVYRKKYLISQIYSSKNWIGDDL